MLKLNKQILVNIIFSLASLLIILFISVFILLPFFSIDKVNLDSELTFTRNFPDIAGLDKYSSYLFLNVNDVKNRIMNEPLVRKVYVKKSFPDTLNVTVYGREALASAFNEKDGISVPMCIDENGVVFQVGNEIKDIDLPVISGDIDFNNVTRGGSIPKVLIPLLKSLKVIRGESPKLYSSISEIYINKRGDMTFDLTLYFTYTSIKALVKGILTSQELKNIVVVTSLLHKEGVSVEQVDFRADEIVYKEKG